jgi:poly-gamma-glutamate capsule biosynthesis protein CapA/YwtB (metallophosphatase superfamily)
MRNRRSRRRNNNSDLLNALHLISKFLMVLIVIVFILFINSIVLRNEKMAKNDINLSESETSSNLPEEDQNIVSDQINNTENTNSKSNTPIKKSATINMAFTGDIMCHNTIYKDAFDSSNNSYDFSYIFDDVKYNIQTADIAVGNLETTFAGSSKGYSSYPTFNTPENLAYTLKKIGFDVLSTANNHCYDSGYSGIESTINYLDDADISHTGTYKSKEEQNQILIKNVKGIKIAFLSFTYGTNGIKVPNDKSYSVNLIDKNLILNQLSLAKDQDPDMICVSMHWGIEYQTSPNSEQKDLADFLFKNGADLIIGNHPHVLQSMEKRDITLDDGSHKDGFVVYSLGNFLADQNKNYTRDSAILNLNITKDSDDKIKINSATYTPTYIYKDTSKSSNKFKILNLKNSIDSYEAGYNSNLSKNTYNTLKTELNNIKKILGDDIK